MRKVTCLKIKALAAFVTLISLTFFASSLPTRAADVMSGVASTYTINDKDAVSGDIICFTDPGTGALGRCQKEFDDKMFGILITAPQLVLRNNPDSQPIVREGRVFVNVTTLSGEIKAGDYLTSSPIPGKAQRVGDYLGYIIGRALTNFTAKDGTAVDFSGKSYTSGMVEVALSIGPLGALPRGTIFDKIGFSLLKSTQNPAGAGLFLRYIVAGLMLIVVSILSFGIFGRNITKGIEAIGRNPLSQGPIQFVIVINTVLIAGVVLGSIILGIIIIRL